MTLSCSHSDPTRDTLPSLLGELVSPAGRCPRAPRSRGTQGSVRGLGEQGSEPPRRGPGVFSKAPLAAGSQPQQQRAEAPVADWPGKGWLGSAAGSSQGRSRSSELCARGSTGLGLRGREQSRMPPSQAEPVEGWGGAGGGGSLKTPVSHFGASWQREVEGEALAGDRQREGTGSLTREGRLGGQA